MPTVEELYAEAIKLDPESRAELARKLTENVQQSKQAAASASENEKERQWIQEAMRRSRELRARNAEQPPGEPPEREMVSAAKTAAPVTVAEAPNPTARSKPRPRPRAKSKPRPRPMPKKARKSAPRPKPRPRAKTKAKLKSKPKPKPRPKAKAKARPARKTRRAR